MTETYLNLNHQAFYLQIFKKIHSKNPYKQYLYLTTKTYTSFIIKNSINKLVYTVIYSHTNYTLEIFNGNSTIPGTNFYLQLLTQLLFNHLFQPHNQHHQPSRLTCALLDLQFSIK